MSESNFSSNRMTKQVYIKIVAGLIGLFLVTTGISYVVFSFFSKATALSPISQETSDARGQIDLSAPKTEECPLTGQKFTEAERDIWQKRRPLGIMIENHDEARPQSGLSRADIVYEAIAEGGITRFLAIYYCGAAREDITVGPVRSARTYYLDWISEYGDYPLYTHVGGANKPGPTDALGQIKSYGWETYNNLNQFSIGFPTFWRDYDRLGRTVATEHTMYSTTDKLWAVAEERKLTNTDEDGASWDENFVSWKFTDDKASGATTVGRISFPFWEGYKQYEVSWVYDAESSMYKRENGGVAHTDLNNNEQIAAGNVIVMFTTVRGPVNELKHMLYTTTGSGKVIVFKDGAATVGTWVKTKRITRTIFKDNSGREIEFARGPVWIEVLQTGTNVEY